MSDEAVFVINKEYGLPYSKGVMAQSLTAAGLKPDRAYALARLIETRLQRRREQQITVDELHVFVVEVLKEEEGADAAERFRRWTQLRRKDVPIILLIGGTTGSGKSTVATQVAHRFGITRNTSTDLIRQVMRVFFSPALTPVLHHSSFDIPTNMLIPEGKAVDPALLGFIEQARLVGVGAQAVVERAEREGMSTLIEGVHLIPGLVQHLAGSRCAVVEAVLYIEDEETHRGHFMMRNLQTDGSRPVDHYLRHFEQIRAVQDYLVDQAQRRGVPVIENTFIDASVSTLMDHVFNVVERTAALKGVPSVPEAVEAPEVMFPEELLIRDTSVPPSAHSA